MAVKATQSVGCIMFLKLPIHKDNHSVITFFLNAKIERLGRNQLKSHELLKLIGTLFCEVSMLS